MGMTPVYWQCQLTCCAFLRVKVMANNQIYTNMGEIAHTVAGKPPNAQGISGQAPHGKGVTEGTFRHEEGQGSERLPCIQAFLLETAKCTALHSRALKLLLERALAAPPGSAHSPNSLADVSCLIHRPSVFSGEQPEKEDVFSWLSTVDCAVGCISTDSRVKAAYAATCLRGQAQVLYNGLIKKQAPSFEELSRFLIKHFGGGNVEHRARQKLRGLYMKEGDLRGYLAEFMKYYSRCTTNPVGPACAAAWFHQGLTVELQSALLVDPGTGLWWSELTTLIDSAMLEDAALALGGKAAFSGAARVAAMQSTGGGQNEELRAGNGYGRMSTGNNALEWGPRAALGSGQASGSKRKGPFKLPECFICGDLHHTSKCAKRFKPNNADQASEAPPFMKSRKRCGRTHSSSHCLSCTNYSDGFQNPRSLPEFA